MPYYNLVCDNNHEVHDIFLKVGERPPCKECGAPTQTLWIPNSNPAVISDEIPGGIEIRHGLCDEATGKPVRYYSKSDIHKEAKRRGLVNYVEHVPTPGSDKAPYTTKESGSVPWAGFKDYTEWDTWRTLHWWDEEDQTKKVPTL